MVVSVEHKKKKGQSVNQDTRGQAWEARVWDALRHLDDRSILNQSPLARLKYIQYVADDKFNGHGLVRGLALKYVLLVCIDRLIVELKEEPGSCRACQFLGLIKQGFSVTAIAQKMGLSRECVSRTHKKKAVKLITQEFRWIVGHSAPTGTE